jgi:cytochrome c oxidase cbb3-type subunit 1
VYSYRLSVVHFWALIFTYMWAGPHHLHYTALPDWTQSVGMIFSLILLAPSWGGMINGIMTLSGAWHKLRDDPILKFLITSLSFYGMSTFEGPMMSIKTVNALSHYTDWTVGHVHSGALGWVAMISIGSIYYLLPRLFGKTEMHSVKLITVHFWVATIGVVLYIASMWIAGVMQGLMWRAVNADGTLTYSFVESVKASYPFWTIRFLGGLLFLSGMLIMAYNMFKTMAGGKADDAPVLALPVSTPDRGIIKMKLTHDKIERNVGLLIVLTLLVVSVGGLVEIVPLFFQKSTTTPVAGLKPYDPCVWPGATSTSAKAATTATRR